MKIDFVCKYISGISTLPMLFIIFPIAVVVKPQYGDTILIGSLIFTWALLIIIAGSVVLVIRSFLHEIGKYLVDASDPPSDIIKAYKQMKILYLSALIFLLLFSPACILSASWSYLRRKFTYFLSLMLFGKSQSELLVLISQMKRKKHASIQPTVKYVAVTNNASKNNEHLTATHTGESVNAMEEGSPNE